MSALAQRRDAQPSGWWGMALFMGAEATVFGSLIATYFYLDSVARSWPPPGVVRPDVLLPLIATGVLILTTVPLIFAARAARAGRRRPVIVAILIAIAIQLAYIAAQVLLFRHDLRDFDPRHSAYGSIYFTLLGAHHAHVVAGVALEAVVLARVAVRGLDDYRMIGVRTVALYWYVVNALAVLVVLTQVSPSL